LFETAGSALDGTDAAAKSIGMGVRSPPAQDAPGTNSNPVESRAAVVIVNYRTHELAKTCLEALNRERAEFRDLKVMVVDGGSDDGSAELLSRFIDQRRFAQWADLLPLPVNGGFGWANNQAIQRLLRGAQPPDYIHLLNPDAEVEQCAVRRLAEYLDTHSRAAAVGSQLVDADGRRSGSAFRFPSVLGEFARGARTGVLEQLIRVKPISIDTSEAAEVDWVTGASVMFRVDALRQVGLFDEGFFLYHEEVELMWRLRKAGWSIATEPKSRVRHLAGAATGVNSSDREHSPPRRNPAYLYRSRTRFFGLTGGHRVAAAAFAAWLAGYAVWKLRRVFHLGSKHNQVEHEFGDHLLKAFPRKHDFEPAVAMAEGEPTTVPAWIDKRWV
jgi:N-acetylglucosaminyl-diphospho-decaprenol L-rhamnosyltransferase